MAGIKVSEYIRIQLQDGPVSEAGVNGCQIDDVIEWCRDALIGFNQPPFKTEETKHAIYALNRAMMWLKRRTASRTARGVEGTSAP